MAADRPHGKPTRTPYLIFTGLFVLLVALLLVLGQFLLLALVLIVSLVFAPQIVALVTPPPRPRLPARKSGLSGSGERE